MKVMISQPMQGKTREQIEEERSELVSKLTDQGCFVIDTIFADEPPQDCDAAIYYLSKSIEAMSKVDAVIFMPGWEEARGCRIEQQVALSYGKFVKYI